MFLPEGSITEGHFYRLAGTFAVLPETVGMTVFAPAYGTFATLFFSFLSAFTVFGVLFLTLQNQ